MKNRYIPPWRCKLAGVWREKLRILRRLAARSAVMCKKNLKLLKRLSALAVLIVALALSSCKSDAGHSYAEFKITLPEEFFEYDAELYDLALTDGVASLGLNRISFVSASQTGIDITLTPRDFATAYMLESGVSEEIYETGDVPYYTTYAGTLDERYFCLYAFYRTPQAYFTLVCMAPSGLESEYKNLFVDYIDNVEILREIE